MKSLIIALILLPTISFSADFMNSKLNVIELKKYRTVAGKLELRYIRENPRLVIRIGAGNKATNDFFEAVMKSDILKLNCDGDFFPMFDQMGVPYVQVNSLKSCVDEEGDVVGHSIGLTALSDADVLKSKKFIEDNLKKEDAISPNNINNSNRPKENSETKDPLAGVLSLKLRPVLSK